MSKELVISAAAHETRVAILEEGQLCEIYIEREKEYALVGSIYKGRVTRVLPGMQSAFVEIGLDGDAFLYVSDFLENLEDYDHVAAPEAKTEKQEPASYAQPASPAPYDAPETASDNSSAPLESQESTPAAPIVDDIILPGETRAARHATGNGSPQEPHDAQAASPADSSPHAPAPTQYNNRSSSNRPPERSSRDSRGGYGRDRGDRGRGGPRGRGGRRGGRDLPPAKYASSRPSDNRSQDRRPFQPRTPEPPPSGGEPILLPGESLAKYREKAAAAGSAPVAASTAFSPSTGVSQHSESPAQSHSSQVSSSDAAEKPNAALPSSLYVGSVYTPPSARVVQEENEMHAEPGSSESSFSGAGENERHAESESSEDPHEDRDHREEHSAPLQLEGSLSDDEATSLAEQLAEAKHEEAQAVNAAAEDHADESAHQALASELEAHESDHDSHHPEEEGDDELHALGVESSEGLHPVGTEADSVAHALIDPDTEQASGETLPGESPSESRPQPTSARIQDSSRARFQRPARRGGFSRGRDRGGRGGSPRPHHQERHGGHGRPAPRRPQLIGDMLKAGEEIIVQIAKEPLGKKGARITSHVALPGRYLVYMPTVEHVGVSRKIDSAENRSRLRRLVNESKGTFPGGFIVRTAASEATDDEIRSDVEFLGRTWDEIRTRSEQRRAPSLLHRDLNLVERILRDYLSDDYTAIWIDNQEEFGKIVEFVGRFQPKLVSRVKLYTKDAPIFEEFGIQQELDKALRPKVWLKSGGYIVINHTEALVAIDVNTGKYVGKGSTRLEDTIVKTNLEAVKEIVRQIRLRDLGGIIVVDFIDMEERRNREKVMAALDSALQGDRAPSKALSFNEFGLVAITRKRTKQALERVLCQPCPYCTGSGMVKSVPTICYEIQAEARKMSAELDSQSVTLRVNPEIAKALKTRESSLVEELEQTTRKSIIIQSDPTLHWEQYDIY